MKVLYLTFQEILAELSRLVSETQLTQKQYLNHTGKWNLSARNSETPLFKYIPN